MAKAVKKKQRGKQNKCRKGKQNIDHALDKVVPETLASVLIFHHGRIDQMARAPKPSMVILLSCGVI